MLQIGILSWNNPAMLARAIESIQKYTTGDWQLLVVDNCSENPGVRDVLFRAMAADNRIEARFLEEDTHYAGGVSYILDWASEQYIVYCDDDAAINTIGWNERMMEVLDQNHQVAMAFPRCYSAYPIDRPGWTEVLWGLGCFWMLKTARAKETGGFDRSLGHQEEVDYTMRLRLEGWKMAAVELLVLHEAKQTRSPESQERINQGVIRFVNKWCAYFCGKDVNYFSANVLRFEDWPVNALHIEDWLQGKQATGQFPILNENARQVAVDDRLFDLCEVPRYPHLYRNRLV